MRISDGSSDVCSSDLARGMGADDESALLLDEAITLAGGEVRTSIWRRAVAMAAIQAADEGDAARAQRLAADALSGSWESARTWRSETRRVGKGCVRTCTSRRASDN